MLEEERSGGVGGEGEGVGGEGEIGGGGECGVERGEWEVKGGE